MNLVVDIGNTLLKFAYFNENEFVENGSTLPDENKIIELVEENKGKAIISSVRNLPPKLAAQINKNTILLNSSTRIPIINNYKTPETLGNDRLANAVAVYSMAGGKNALAIDCGTCLKFDLVLDGAYEGGSISPGLEMRLKAVHTFTDKLPLIKSEKFDQLNGMNTKESILSGCVRGMSAEIRQTISDYEATYGDLFICITGGDHLLFADPIKNRIFADPFLTLKGLNEILNYQ